MMNFIRKPQKNNRQNSGVSPINQAENVANLGDCPRIPKSFLQPRLSNQKYRMKRITVATDVTQQALTLTAPTYQFALSDLPNYAEFTGLFDQYRFRFVRMTFRPRFNMATVTTITAAIFPNLYTVIDYDDNNALAALNDARQYQSLKQTRFDEDHVRFIRPRVAAALFNNGSPLFSGYGNEAAPWIDSATPDVKHFGIKGLVEPGVSGQTALQSWSVELEYFLEFRQSR